MWNIWKNWGRRSKKAKSDDHNMMQLKGDIEGKGGFDTVWLLHYTIFLVYYFCNGAEGEVLEFVTVDFLTTCWSHL